MIRIVQLDKNAGGKKLRNACNEQGAVQCELLPEDLRDKLSDEEVVEFGSKNGYLTLTFDTGFFISASSRLARRHSGVLILRQDYREGQKPLPDVSTKTAPRILSDFKNAFPEWNSAPWDNAVIELTPTLLYLHRVPRSELIRRDEPNWQTKLRRYLEEGSNILPPGT